MSFWWFDIISRSLDVTKCVENTQNGRGVIYTSRCHLQLEPLATRDVLSISRHLHVMPRATTATLTVPDHFKNWP